MLAGLVFACLCVGGKFFGVSFQLMIVGLQGIFVLRRMKKYFGKLYPPLIRLCLVFISVYLFWALVGFLVQLILYFRLR